MITAATTPASASNETGSVSSRSVADLIKIDTYLASRAAVKRPDLGLRITTFGMPGAF